MDNKLTRDFAVKFNELNSDNQRYIIAIQQALAYAQSSALEAKKEGVNTNEPKDSLRRPSTTKLEYPNLRREGENMKVNRKKLELSMARACVNGADLPGLTGLPRPTVQNAIVGKGVRPGTLGRIAKALNVDPTEIMEQET